MDQVDAEVTNGSSLVVGCLEEVTVYLLPMALVKNPVEPEYYPCNLENHLQQICDNLYGSMYSRSLISLVPGAFWQSATPSVSEVVPYLLLGSIVTRQTFPD